MPDTLPLSLSSTQLAVSFAGGLAGLSPSRFNTLEAKYGQRGAEAFSRRSCYRNAVAFETRINVTAAAVVVAVVIVIVMLQTGDRRRR